MQIRAATIEDLEELYQIGLDTPEFKVSNTRVFMEKEAFRFGLQRTDAVFLVAQEPGQPIAGFVYADMENNTHGMDPGWACIMYLVVIPEYRKQGIAQQLYDACVVELKKRGAKKIYTWANVESDQRIVAFLKKQGFVQGHTYVWMDNDL